MPPENIFAYTAPGADSPEYVSVNKAPGGGIDLIVRSPKAIGGATAQLYLSNGQLLELIQALAAHASSEAQVKHMAEQFLRWKLPPTFRPDGGISFEPVANAGTPHEHRREPSGTNLLDYSQADVMVRHMLAGLPTA